MRIRVQKPRSFVLLCLPATGSIRAIELLRELAEFIASSLPAFPLSGLAICHEEELDELLRENVELQQALSEAEAQMQSEAGPGLGGVSSDTIPLANSGSGQGQVRAFGQAFGDGHEAIQLLLEQRRARAGRTTMANTHP